MPGPLSRRGLLRSALAAGAVVTAGSAGLAFGWNALATSAPAGPAALPFALVVDTTKCVGCGACREACTLRNHLPENTSYIHIVPEGEGPDRRFLPVQCQHCASAPCAAGLPDKRPPTGATTA